MVTVTVQCVLCKTTREIKAGDVPPGGHPTCQNDFMPMVPIEAKAKLPKKKRK